MDWVDLSVSIQPLRPLGARWSGESLNATNLALPLLLQKRGRSPKLSDSFSFASVRMHFLSLTLMMCTSSPFRHVSSDILVIVTRDLSSSIVDTAELRAHSSDAPSFSPLSGYTRTRSMGFPSLSYRTAEIQ